MMALGGCAAGVAASGESGRPAAGTGAVVGKPMPPVVARAFSGTGEVRLDRYKGKVVLLDVWASWCAPCKEELPLLDDLGARLGKRGVVIIAVSIDEDHAAAAAFLDIRPRWSLTIAHDPEGRIGEQLSPPKMPTSYVIDRQGVLRHINAGFDRGDATKLEEQLTALTE